MSSPSLVDVEEAADVVEASAGGGQDSALCCLSRYCCRLYILLFLMHLTVQMKAAYPSALLPQICLQVSLALFPNPTRLSPSEVTSGAAGCLVSRYFLRSSISWKPLV